jgi:7,8-dihydro-6-hydroxymethylpterin-pyrophosphokinase
LFERAFVLIPLAEIAPEVRINGIRVGDAIDAIAELDRSSVIKLPPR